MELNIQEIKTSLIEAALYIDNTSYEMLLNMPVTERDLMVKLHNKKIRKQNEKQ